MTRYDPALFVNRLIVVSRGTVAYDERFHRGVNIIRGEDNAVGKSTIANMIFYVLGGEEINWTDAALECSDVIAEVELSGAEITLQRVISNSKERPLKIFWGDYKQATHAPPTAWEAYPFAQRGDSISFSQVLFRALGIPEVKESLQARITMYQVLRLLFADQHSPHNEVFRHQDWIAKDTLAAVGSLLCGHYDGRLYELGIQLKNLTAERDTAQVQLRSVWSVLKSDENQVAGLEFLSQQLDEVKERLRKTIEAPLSTADGDNATEPTPPNQDAIARLSDEITRVRRELADTENDLRSLEFEISDSAMFIDALTSNKESLHDSNVMRDALGSVRFELCPACLSPIAEDNDSGNCPLCKNPYHEEEQRARFLHLRQQLAQQIEESMRLQEGRTRQRDGLNRQLPKLRSQQKSLQLELAQATESLASDREEAIAKKYRRMGYLVHEVESLEQQITLATQINQLVLRCDNLDAQIRRIKEERLARTENMKQASLAARKAVEDNLVKILKRDIGVQEEFKNPREVTFDFRENEVKVNGKNNFAESSMVYLRNAFRLALLMASTQHDFFRYPRFALFDDLEEGGMVAERTQNFQRVIVEMSEEAPSEHQIIFTTSMVDEKLNESDLTVGEYYTRSNPALRLPSGRIPESLADGAEGRGEDSD